MSTCFEEKRIDSAAVQQLSVYALESPTPVYAIFEMAESAGIESLDLLDKMVCINKILEAPTERSPIDFCNDLYVWVVIT